MAKAGAGIAFANKKKAAEARLAAQESGIELDENYNDDDIFELQHHHLLRCLEKTTVTALFELKFESRLTWSFLRYRIANLLNLSHNTMAKQREQAHPHPWQVHLIQHIQRQVYYIRVVVVVVLDDIR